MSLSLVSYHYVSYMTLVGWMVKCCHQFVALCSRHLAVRFKIGMSVGSGKDFGTRVGFGNVAIKFIG